MKKIFSKKNTFIFSVTLLSSLAIFAVARPAHASEVIAGIIGGILSVVIYFIGQLLSLVISVLISIAQYSAFGTAAPVVFGWMIVRDICNMFFVLILLIIAFATILHVEEYNYKKWLPKLIMMAVLINFSRLICNIFVDFAQVVMLTFVNGFKDVGGGNLTEMLGINDWIGTMSTDPSATVTFTTIVGTYLLALIYSVIALITVVTMVAVLAMRMVMLWIYITLSPLAYLLSAFPQGQQYASKWWSEFSKNLVIGPILAFFIWLSFASLGGTADLAANNATDPLKGIPSDPSSTPSVGLTESGSADNMIKFIISIGMLLGGLQIAQELGGEAGKMAGKVSSKGFSMAKTSGSWVGNKALRGATVAGVATGNGLKVAAGFSDRLAGSGIDKIMGKFGKKTSLGEQGLATTSFGALATAPAKLKESISKRFTRDSSLNNFRRDAEHGEEAVYEGKNYKYDGMENSFVETNVNGNEVKQINWKKIEKEDLGQYRANLGDKQYEYDDEKDAYYELEDVLDNNNNKVGQKRKMAVDKDGKEAPVALQHNGKDLKAAEFNNFAQNVKGAGVSFGAEKYKFDNKAGDFRNVNKTGGFEKGDKSKALATEAVEKSYLRRKGDAKTGEPGEVVTAMGSARRSWHDAYKSSYSAANATRNKAEDETVSKEQAKISESGITSGDMLRELGSAATSVDRKKALAIALAIKEGFKNKGDVDKARAALGNNKILTDKFNDTVDKKQAHLNYDFTSVAGRDKFKSRIDSGKIDTTKLDHEAYENPAMLSAMKEYHGKDYGRVIETAAKRGDKYEKSVAKGQLASRTFANDGSLYKEYNYSANGVRGNVKDVDGAAKSYAKITGDHFEAFKKQDGSLDSESFAKFLKDAKTADYNKIDGDKFSAGLESLESAISAGKAAGADNKVKAAGVKAAADLKAIVQSIKTTNLKKMVTSGENNGAAEIITKVILQKENGGTPDQQNYVKCDKELMANIGLAAISKKGKKGKQADEDEDEDDNDNV